MKNRGTAFAMSSFRHNFLPVAASKQERVPRTPNVTTFPSATVGELRDPGNCEAAPVAPSAAYLSSQI